MFDASEEGLALQKEKAEQGLKHLAQVAVIRETSRVMKQQLNCPEFVTCMEDEAKIRQLKWNKRKAEILQQWAAGILLCMCAIHAGSNAKVPEDAISMWKPKVFSVDRIASP